MTDYATLQADILAFSTRDEFSAVVTTFIRLAEPFIYRKLRVMEMETDAILTLTSGNNYEVALPSGFEGFKHVTNTTSSNPKTTYLSPDDFHEQLNSASDAFAYADNSALFYTIEANKLKADVPAGATTNIVLDVTYFKRPDVLSDSNNTNDILVRHYDIFLFVSLAMLWKYAMDTDEETKNLGFANMLIGDIESSEKRRRNSGGPLQTKPPAVIV